MADGIVVSVLGWEETGVWGAAEPPHAVVLATAATDTAANIILPGRVKRLRALPTGSPHPDSRSLTFTSPSTVVCSLVYVLVENIGKRYEPYRNQHVAVQ